MAVENNVAITIRVPLVLRDRFNRACEKRGTTVSKSLRAAIENFITVAETGDGELLAKTRLFKKWDDRIMRRNVVECILFLEAGNRVGEFPILTPRYFVSGCKTSEHEYVFRGPTSAILEFVKKLDEHEDEEAIKWIELFFKNARERNEKTKARHGSDHQADYVVQPEDIPYLD